MPSRDATTAFLAAAACAVASLGAVTVAHARDVYWSVGISSPGVQVGVGNARPVVVAPPPVYYSQPPAYYSQPPAYYSAPPVVYGAPPVVYGPPPVVYGAPRVVYGPPAVVYAPRGYYARNGWAPPPPPRHGWHHRPGHRDGWKR